MTLAHVGHYASPSVVLFVVPLLLAGVWMAVSYVLNRRRQDQGHEPARQRPVRDKKKR